MKDEFTWWHTALIIIFIFTTTIGIGKEFIIYSINQTIPMGEPNEIIKKNYYINMGGKQGLEKGTTLDVLRTIYKRDAYESKGRYNYKVKIGEMKVIHTEDTVAIGKKNKIFLDKDDPLFEIEDFMIGDTVKIHLK